MLYQVTLHTPNATERSYSVTRSFIVGTLRAAQLAAEELLPPASETDYSARVARHPFVEVHPVRRFCPMSGGREYRPCGARAATYETPIEYVPSCGDRGWF